MNMVCNWKGRGAIVTTTLAVMFAPSVASAEVVTLREIEDLALQNQTRWETVDASSNRARAEVDAARAGKMPTFWMNASGVVAPGSDIERIRTVDDRVVNVRASPTVTERTSFRPNIRYEATIEMNAPVYNGQTRAAIKAAEAFRAAASASAGASRETVLTMVRAAYLDWLESHLTHELALGSMGDAKAQRKRIEERVADGERAPSELESARYGEIQAELDAAEARARAATAKRLLESAVGSELSDSAAPDTSLLGVASQLPDRDTDWEAEALELQREAAHQEARMHRKGRLPVLAAVGQTGFAGVNERVFPMYRLGLNLAVPLWDGGRAVALGRAADAHAGELGARAREARLARKEARQQALLDREHAEGQLALANRLVSVSQTQVEQAQLSFELGAGDVEAVADARVALRDAQSRRLQIRVARTDAILRLSGDR
jgi:outer membrane protein TolC